MKNILKLIGVIVLLLIIIVLINTFRYPSVIASHTTVSFDKAGDSAIHHLSKAAQIKTISWSDTAAIDTAAFLQLRSFIEQAYPLFHQKLQRQIFNGFSYLYKWQGKNPALKPYVLMAHTDVVPVEEASENKWTAAPFGATIKDNRMYGRGVADDKASFIAVLEAAEQLLQQGYQPQQTIYFSFGHDEEIGGKHGAAVIANWFKQNNIHPQLVLDEGGMITKENFKELGRPIAVLGVAEKGYSSYTLTVQKPGGHSSMPEKENSIDALSAALLKLQNNPMPAAIIPVLNETFSTIGPGMPFTMRMALANMWLFKPMLISKLSDKKESSAMIHNTLVPTIINAGVKDNVIPGVATATVNSRILPGSSVNEVKEHMIKTISDTSVKVEVIKAFATEPSAKDAYNTPAYNSIKAVIEKLLPGVVVTPYLTVGATDSRRFRPIADAVVNFFPAVDLKGFHGIDENISLEDFGRMIAFYKMVMKGN